MKKIEIIKGNHTMAKPSLNERLLKKLTESKDFIDDSLSNRRTIVAKIEIDEKKMFEVMKDNFMTDTGDIDYLIHEFKYLEPSGIYIKDARILDEDDKEDSDLIKYLCKLF